MSIEPQRKTVNVRSKQPTVLIFVSATCGHCRNAKAEFEKLVSMSDDEMNVQMFTRDRETKHLFRIMGVNSFPTILFAYKKKWAEYGASNKREADLIEHSVQDFSKNHTSSNGHGWIAIPDPRKSL